MRNRYRSYNSLPLKCDGNKPLPLCGPSSFGTRGSTINLHTCQCVPACPSGQYYLGETGTGPSCGNKSQYNAQSAADNKRLDCINKGGVYDENNLRCSSIETDRPPQTNMPQLNLGDLGLSSLGFGLGFLSTINPIYLIGGGIVVAIIIGALILRK